MAPGVHQGRPSPASYPVFGVQHDDGVAPHDDHADVGPGPVLGELHALVQHQVHEGVVAA